MASASKKQQKPLQLRRNNISGTVSSALYNYFRAQKFTDMTLSCQNRSIKCHRIVLSSASPYFEEELLKHETSYPIIVIGGMSFSTLERVVEYTYTGKVTVEEKEMFGFLLAAKRLKLKGLVDPNDPTGQLDPTAGELGVEFSSRKKANVSKKGYSAANLLAAIKDVQNGISSRVAARARGIPATTLYDTLQKQGISTAMPQFSHKKTWISRKARSYTREDLAAAVQDVINGKTGADAARARNIPFVTFYDNLKRLGISYKQNRMSKYNKRLT